MARGNIAKEQATKTIIKAFGNSFVCVQDKKIYVWAEENGEKVQIAITLTCPKAIVEGHSLTKANSDEECAFATTPVDISPEDKRKIEKLKEKLGINGN